MEEEFHLYAFILISIEIKDNIFESSVSQKK